MSSLQVTTIKSNATSTCPVIQDSAATEIGQFCKVWASFTCVTTTALNDSFNVSSLTDNGTGDTTVNFTTSLANANYSVTASSGTSTTIFSESTGFGSKAVGSVSIYSGSAATGVANDRYDNAIAIFSN